ncbi:uncharacterized protein LOC119578514 [Penaeus monodon]|uniref:uncharacterized protein LOC119578514 n=1 Tax=Penaeus monodon TaxID=6687 RepID=UPI0018A7BF09|nr:uncharacterized protein LOC119578514 [Penaeus monodon]
MTDGFEVKVGLYQGSALSPILFNVVMGVMTEEVREEPPWCILHADDIVLVVETKQELQRKMERWRTALESRGLKISRKKTEYFTMDTEGDQQSMIQIDGLNLKRVDHFKYLGAMVKEDGSIGREIKHRIQCGWNNWRKVSGVICDKRVLVKLKGKVHKSVVRPAMTYGLETAPLRKVEERKLDVAEMKMLRWMVGVTKIDCIRNNYIRGSLKVTEISKNVQESRLRCLTFMKMFVFYVKLEDDLFLKRRGQCYGYLVREMMVKKRCKNRSCRNVVRMLCTPYIDRVSSEKMIRADNSNSLAAVRFPECWVLK